MRSLFITGLFFLISFMAFSQGQGGQMPVGSVYGKLIDSASGKPIEAASVQLLRTQIDTATKSKKEVVVAGMLTQANGQFRLEGIPAMGRYNLVISAINYKAYSHPFSFIDRNAMANSSNRNMNALLGALDKDLGNIKLAMDQQLLSGVTVIATRPGVQLGIDRKIYNVENNLTSAGGNATDVLKTVPSVNVDIDGNVSIRNSSPQIFVDGRPTTLSLDQIPADQISSVEVITNPSAKYDASGGTAGILNIVLKKTRQTGYNGSVRAGIDERGKYNFGGNINVKQGKFNVFANAAYNQRRSISDGTTERSTIFGDSVINLNQTDRSINNGRFMFGRLGFDYLLDNRNTITIAGMGVNGKFNNTANSSILVDSLFDDNDIQSKILRATNGNFNFRMMGGTVGYVHNFPKSGHQLTMDANYNRNRNNSITLINNRNFALSTGPQTSASTQQQNSDGNGERLNAQVDYANPFSEKSKIETGARFNQNKTTSRNLYHIVNSDGTLTLQPALSSNFNYKEQVYAGYINFSSKIGEKFGYQLGLRLESSDYNGIVHNSVKAGDGAYRDSISNFKVSYPASLFPSIFLSQQLANDQQLQLNYSRRINRPGFFQLFPFVDYSDSLNLSRGNPNLKPEFTNSFELSYSKNFDRSNNLIMSVYYKNTNGLITRYQSPEVNPATGGPMLVNTYINANSSYVGGFEAVTKNSLTKWWDVTGNLNIYTSKINIDDPSIATADQLYSWFAKLNNSFKLPANFTVQLSGDYNSKTVLAPGGSGTGGGGGGGRGFGGSVSGNAQGYSMPVYGVDMAIKYEFMKNKAASLTLSGNDIFKTRAREVYTNSNLFTQHDYRVRDQQFFSINFAYKFGKFDASLLKRKNLRAEQEGMQGGMQDMQQ